MQVNTRDKGGPSVGPQSFTGNTVRRKKKNEREGWKNEIRAQARGIGKWRCHPSVTEFPALKKLAVYIVSNPTAVGEKVTVKSGQRKINRWPMGSFSDSVDVESEVAENESQKEKKEGTGPYLFLCVQIDDLADVEQVAVKGRQPLARLDVKSLQLSLRLVDGRMEQLAFRLLWSMKNIVIRRTGPAKRVHLALTLTRRGMCFASQ